jgi:hypothetical protein
MFDDVGDVGPRSIDAGLGEAAVEQLSRGSDKRVTGNVLRITRLLADQHNERPVGALTEHGPGSVPIQPASSAMGRGLAQAIVGAGSGGSCPLSGREFGGCPVIFT